MAICSKKMRKASIILNFWPKMTRFTRCPQENFKKNWNHPGVMAMTASTSGTLTGQKVSFFVFLSFRMWEYFQVEDLTTWELHTLKMYSLKLRTRK